MANSTLRATFAYEGTNFTRNYDFEIEDEFKADAKNKVLAINASMEAGTAGGLSTFFVSDNGENFIKISSAKIITVTETQLDLEGE